MSQYLRLFSKGLKVFSKAKLNLIVESMLFILKTNQVTVLRHI